LPRETGVKGKSFPLLEKIYERKILILEIFYGKKLDKFEKE